MLEICADSWIFLSSVLFGSGVVIEPFSFFFSLNPGALPGSLWQCLGLLCLRCVQRVKLRDPLCCKRRLRYRRCSTALPLAALCGCRERPGHSARPPRRVPVSGRAQRGPGTCRRSARGPGRRRLCGCTERLSLACRCSPAAFVRSPHAGEPLGK